MRSLVCGRGEGEGGAADPERKMCSAMRNATKVERKLGEIEISADQRFDTCISTVQISAGLPKTQPAALEEAENRDLA